MDNPKYVRCICCSCAFTSKNVYSSAGWAETQISGMCEKCFDAMFEEDDYEQD